MKNIPPQIQKALKVLEQLDYEVKKKKIQLELAESDRRAQASAINQLWKEHAAWLQERLKGKAVK